MKDLPNKSKEQPATEQEQTDIYLVPILLY